MKTMTITTTSCCTLAVTLCVAAASSAYGRSLIHYFDFDAQSSANGYKICPEAEGLRLERFMGIVILVR